MKVSIYCMILPRLEFPYLEEWLLHHLNLGFDKIYLYDNGKSVEKTINSFRNDVIVGHDNDSLRQLEDWEKGMKWQKKPDDNYHLELTDEEVSSKIHKTLEKVNKQFKNSVELIKWRYGKETNYKFPTSHTIGYRDCTENNHSDWWLAIDTDEYINLKKHNNIKEFINSKCDATSIRLTQRVFEKRTEDKPVKSIFEYGYDINLNKTLVKSPIYFYTNDAVLKIIKENSEESLILEKFTVTNDIHTPVSLSGLSTKHPGYLRLLLSKRKKYRVMRNRGFTIYKEPPLNDLGAIFDESNWRLFPFDYGSTDRNEVWCNWRIIGIETPKNDEIVYHHYRGNPYKMGGHGHRTYIEFEKNCTNFVYKPSEDFKFNKIDKSMKKYIN